MKNDFTKVRAIIFDMDGVLFLSSNCHEKAFKETLADTGITDFSYSSIAGMRTDDAFKKIFVENEQTLHDNYLKKLVEKKRKKAQEFLVEESEVVTGSAELVSRLRKKYRLVLVSSASSQTVELFLKKSGYADVFEFFLDGSAVLNAKPAPEIYQLAVQKLGLMPEECVVIEDSVSGVRAALSAKIPTIAIIENKGREEEFALLKPIMVVSNITDIEPLLLS